MRIAEFSESSKFWTHIALPGYAWEYACISVRKSNLPFFFCVVSDWNGRMWSVLKVWLLSDHQVLLNRHCLSILLLWSVMHERGDLLIACMCWRLRWEHIEETTICGMFGFGWHSCLLCVESVFALRCTSMCGLERWFAVLVVCCCLWRFLFGDCFRKKSSWETNAAIYCCISIGPDIRQDYPLNLSI